MKIITDRPIYSNVEGEAKMKPLGATQLPSSIAMPDKLNSGAPAPKNKKPLGGLFAKKDKTESTATKGGGGLFQKKDTNKSDKDLVALAERIKTMSQAEVEALLKTLTKFEIAEIKRIQRKEKRQNRKASRTAKKLIRAKDKNGKKRWFYPISQVFKGKKKAADGSIVEVAQKDIVTTSNGTQFDKTDISKATGIPVENITASTVENSAVTFPANSTVTENTQLTPFVKRPPEPASKSTESVQDLKEMTVVAVGVSDSREIISLPSGETYLSQETLLEEEQEPDPKKKTLTTEEQKGLGVWGWVGVSAIVVGLGLGAYLLYSMSTSKK